jgi:hypothetical protein
VVTTPLGVTLRNTISPESSDTKRLPTASNASAEGAKKEAAVPVPSVDWAAPVPTNVEVKDCESTHIGTLKRRKKRCSRGWKAAILSPIRHKGGYRCFQGEAPAALLVVYYLPSLLLVVLY